MAMPSLNPAKYDGKPVADLRRALLRKDAAALEDKSKETLRAGRTRRVVTATVASALLGVVTTKFPWLTSLGGTPIGIDHAVAVVGTIAAFGLTESDDDSPKDAEDNLALSDIAEGVAMSGLVPIARGVGAKGMAVAESLT